MINSNEAYNPNYIIPSLKKRIERAQEREKANLKTIQTDFMENLPEYIRRAVDEARWSWNSYPWFEEAWDKYRSHVLQAVENGTKIKGPGFIFNDYIDEQVEKDITEEEVLNIMHCDSDIDELEHSAAKKVVKAVAKKAAKTTTGTSAAKAVVKKAAKTTAGSGTTKKVAKKVAEKVETKAKRPMTVKQVENSITKGQMIFKAVLGAGIITAITVGALRRRAKRKQAGVNRKEAKKDRALLRKEAVKDAKMQTKINKILSTPSTGNYSGPERYPAGTPGGLGGQFKPKNA